MNKFSLFPSDLSFQEFAKNRTIDRLNTKYQPISYLERFKRLRLLSLISSYVFNIFSAITASILVLFFAQQFIQYWIPSILITVIFLVILEITKRITANTIFKDALQFRTFNYGFISIACLLVGLSILFSYNGSKYAVQEFTNEPTIQEISILTKSIDQRIKKLESDKAKARATKYKGVTTSPSQKTIQILSAQIAELEKEKSRITVKEELKNEQILFHHKNQTYLEAKYFAMITALSEVLFLICVFYCEYYDFRSYIELSGDANINISMKSRPLGNPNSEMEIDRGKIVKNRLITPASNLSQKTHTEKRICVFCEKGIDQMRKDAKYCSTECRKSDWSKKNGREPYLKSKK